MLRLVPNEAALVIKSADETVLAASDLHIGLEKALSERGINIPSQTDKLAEKLLQIIASQKPDRLVLLGDVKHGTVRIHSHEWRDVPLFFEKVLGAVDKVQVVPGNHDGGLEALLPRDVIISPSRGIVVKDGGKRVTLLHGHAWPLPELLTSDVMVMGHHHFTVQLREATGLRLIERVWVMTGVEGRVMARAYLKYQGIKVRRSALATFKKEWGVDLGSMRRIMIMPAFNPILSGLPINSLEERKYLGPFFQTRRSALTKSELYLLDGTYLGKTSDLMGKRFHALKA